MCPCVVVPPPILARQAVGRCTMRAVVAGAVPP
jgi:hypothetical protein